MTKHQRSRKDEVELEDTNEQLHRVSFLLIMSMAEPKTYAVIIISHLAINAQYPMQTPRKFFGFSWSEDIFWPDLADIKHGYTQEFYLIFYQPMSEDQ